MLLTYELVLRPPIPSTNLLFLRSEAFWGGQLCWLKIGLCGSFRGTENFWIKKKNCLVKIWQPSKSHQKKMLNAQIIMFRGARIFTIIFLLNSYFHVDQFLFLYAILHYFMYFFRHKCHFFIQHTPVYSYAVNRE